MNWCFCIITREQRALNLCDGSMNKGSNGIERCDVYESGDGNGRGFGYGSGFVNGNGYGFGYGFGDGDGYGFGYGNGYGDGRQAC